jgi:hypothetical protein
MGGDARYSESGSVLFSSLLLGKMRARSLSPSERELPGEILIPRQVFLSIFYVLGSITMKKQIRFLQPV